MLKGSDAGEFGLENGDTVPGVDEEIRLSKVVPGGVLIFKPLALVDPMA